MLGKKKGGPSKRVLANYPARQGDDRRPVSPSPIGRGGWGEGRERRSARTRSENGASTSCSLVPALIRLRHVHRRHPCRRPFGRLRRANRQSCRFVSRREKGKNIERPSHPFTHSTWRSVCTTSTRSVCAAITASIGLYAAGDSS